MMFLLQYAFCFFSLLTRIGGVVFFLLALSNLSSDLAVDLAVDVVPVFVLYGICSGICFFLSASPTIHFLHGNGCSSSVLHKATYNIAEHREG